MPMSKSYSSSDISSIGPSHEESKRRLQKSTSKPNLHGLGGNNSPSNASVVRANLNPYLPSRNTKRKAKVKRRKVTSVVANLAMTKYPILEKVCLKLGMTTTDYDSSECFLIWSDSAVPMDRITEMKSYQKINHFPGMAEICRKDLLAKNTARLSKIFPEEYSFVPQTWIMPSEHVMFKSYCRELKKNRKIKTFIVKPANGAMGNGIFLMRSTDKLDYCENYIIQEYIDKPLLIDGFKFDLRLYVFVMNIDPLKIFLYNDGLVRMGTEGYSNPRDSNLDCLYMHLTNYSINKHSEKFLRSSEVDSGSKRSIKFLMDWLKNKGTNVVNLWGSISDVVIKTIIAALPHVTHAYRMCRPSDNQPEESSCFEILGFDILLDRSLNPWVIEVNRAPSFGTDQALDLEIKSGVLYQALKLLNIRTSDKKRALAADREKSRQRLMRQPNRPNHDLPEEEKQLHTIEKKKKELKQELFDVRRLAAKEEFENRNLGSYMRIYPTENKQMAEKYRRLIEESEKCFTGRSSRKTWRHNLAMRERDLLNQLEQVESDEMIVVEKSRNGRQTFSHLNSPRNGSIVSPSKSEKHLSSLPLSTKTSDLSVYSTKSQHTGISPASYSTQETAAIKSLSSSPNMHNTGVLDDLSLSDTLDETEKDRTRQVLRSLNTMKIKFPGKSDSDAASILNEIQENWKFHKPRVASYWLVKLDSVKRRKVIEIVRGNVRTILQRVWETPSADNLRLSKLFAKLYNRFLWGNGQGMWHCFNKNGEPWEAMLTKGDFAVSSLELNCCRRIVQLCRDCLLVVYQFANEAKASTPSSHASGRLETSVSRPLYVQATSSERQSRLDLANVLRTSHRY